MQHLKIYYGTPAGIWTAINGPHIVDPKSTNEYLIRGEVQTSLRQNERYDPVGIFNPAPASYYTVKDPDGRKSFFMFGEVNLPPIDYETISPEDLRSRLLSRIDHIREYLIDPEIEIECFREEPLGAYIKPK